MFMVTATRNSIFIELDKFGREKQPQKRSDSSIRFIEFASLKLSLVKGNVKIDLFLAIGSVGCEVIIDDVLFFCQLHKLEDVVQIKTWLENDEEVNISMNFLFWQWDVGLYPFAQWRNQLEKLLGDLLVLCGCQLLQIFKCVSSHSVILLSMLIQYIKRCIFFYIQYKHQASTYSSASSPSSPSSSSQSSSSSCVGSPILSAMALSIRLAFHNLTHSDILYEQ